MISVRDYVKEKPNIDGLEWKKSFSLLRFMLS